MPSVAEYFAVLGLQPDRESFTTGQRLLNGVASSVTKLGGVIAATFAFDAVTGFVRDTIAAVPAIGDLARQTGFTAEEIQRLGFAAAQGGADAATLEGGLLKLTKNIGEAAKGGQGAIDAFTAVGVSITDIAKRDPRQVFGAIVDGLKGIPEVGKRAEIAASLFGLSGAKLAPFLAQGEDAIAAMGDEAQNLGLILDGVTIQRVDDLDDSLNAATATISGAARGLVVELLPAIEAGAKGLAFIAVTLAKIPRFVSANAKVFKALAITIGAVATVAAVQWLATLAAFAIGSLAAAASNSVLAGSFGIVAGVIDIASLAALKFLARLAAIAAPAIAVGALLALIVVIVDDIITTIQGGDSFFGSFSGRFDQLAASLRAAAGDDGLGFFARVLAGVGSVFASVFGFIDGEFDRFFRRIEALVAIGDFVVALFTNPVEALRSLFSSAIAEFTAFVAKGSALAGKVAGFAGSFIGGDTGARLSAISQSLSAPSVGAPTVSASGGSRNVNVGAPNVTVNVTGAGDPRATAAAVADVAGPSFDQALRQAAVDNLVGAG